MPQKPIKRIGQGFSYEVNVPVESNHRAPIRKTSPFSDQDHLFKTGAGGVKKVVCSIRISSAHIVDVTQQMDSVNSPGQPLDGIEHWTVFFTFGKIEISHPVGAGTASYSIP
jgi:hypothetical protein